MSRRERRVADEPAVAVEHGDLDLDGLARNDSGGGLPIRRAPPHDQAARLPRRRGRRLPPRCWRRECVRQARASRRPARQACASTPRSTEPRRECRSSRPWASLVILPTPPAMVTRGTGCVRRYLSMPPTKSPMSISAVSGRSWSFCTAASEAEPVAPAICARPAARATSMPLMDRMDPGRAGIGHDDAGGAEDRQSADDAEPPVEGLGGQRLAAGNGDLDLDVAGIAVGGGNLGNGFAQHLARHGVDGGLARRNGKARPRHRAHAFAGTEADAASARGAADRGEDQRPVGDVGIVAGILHHAGRRRAVAQRRGGQREGRMLPARQGHLDRIGKLAGQQRLIGRLGGRRGAGAGGPAVAERAVVGCHAPRYSADNPFRHCRRRGP